VGQSAAQTSDNAGAAIAAAFVGGLVQGAWNSVVFFAVPILVAEDVGMIETLKRSATLFKRTWGEGFVGRTTLGGVAFLLGLAVVGVGAVLVGLAAASGSAALVMGAIVLVVLALACVGLLSGAINGVFQASLYAYATTGNAGRFIDTALARDAFRAA
jgi:hypothetical protein